ncbi:hypothetical protein M9H77_36018 [Catharanthus roseus]|uniref:Uncharacterized protein n=1 Tax=Catharanthus roseus TaxID=4058 RepID=A0ACB9ZR01_CATRO|nr:hypothetical protein M9H77_36018 [Catharanthus roseus]
MAKEDHTMWYQGEDLFEEKIYVQLIECEKGKVLNVLKCIEEEEIMGDFKDTILVITMVAIAMVATTILYEFQDESFQRRGRWNWDKHENMESFQGPVTSFKGLVTRLRARKIGGKHKKTSLEEFEAIKAKEEEAVQTIWLCWWKGK